MKQARFGTLKKLTAPVMVYESYDEADKAAGRENAMLEEGNASRAYRGPLNEVRDWIADQVEKLTGVERETKETNRKDRDGNPVLAYVDAPGDYVSKACATKGIEDLASLQTELDAWAKTANEGAALAIDIRERERKAPQPKKLAEKYVQAAKNMFAKGTVDKFLSDASVVLEGTQALVGDTDEAKIESLGRIVRLFIDAKEKQALGSL